MNAFYIILKSLPDFKLRFDENKERIFRADYIGNSLIVIRAGYILCIILYAVFGLLDIWIVPETVNFAWFIRFAVVIPLLLFTILLSFTDFFKRFNQIILIISSAIVGLGIVVMIACSKPTELGYKYYYSGLMLVIFWIYTFIRLRFWNSIISALIITLGYEIIAVFIQHLTDSGMESKNTMVFINNNFFFISANIIGLWASYYIEKLHRSNFMQNRIIIDENVRIKNISDMLLQKNEKILAQSAEIEAQSEELEYANIILEEKVQERTEELQKTNNELIIARDKAQASDRLKTAFMQNISHEVRTPLHGILGFSSVIADPEFDSSDKLLFLTMLKNSSDRLVNTITDYMDMSLMASGNMEVSKKRLAVNAELSDIVSKYHEMCLQKALTFSFTINKAYDGLSFQTDPEIFRKIIAHLLDNAVKFTKKGSVTLNYSITDIDLEIQVRDTGVGISEEAQERIFESFMQEEVASTRGHEGSGLGLSIVSGLLKLIGGEIRLESVKGEGSSFIVTIPFEGLIGTPKTDEGRIFFPDNVISSVILIVEDDDMNREFLEIILANHVEKVLQAINGKEAVEICRNHPEVSLVLMDIKMPVMNGYEATRKIKSFRNDLPVIAITAYAMSGDEQLARDAGCDDFMTKPVTMRSLKEKLKKFGIKM